MEISFQINCMDYVFSFQWVYVFLSITGVGFPPFYMLLTIDAQIAFFLKSGQDSRFYVFVCLFIVCLFLYLQYMPAAAAAPMQGTYIPQYTAVPASAITVEVRTKSASLSS